MKKHWVIFLLVVMAGLLAVAFVTRKDAELNDVPSRIPSKEEIVTPGLSTNELIKTSDEARIPDMMEPTPIIKLVVNRLFAISCAKGSQRCQLQAIYDFVRQSYELHERSPEHWWIQPPGQTLLYGSGDEMELAILQSSMQRAAGFENEILRSPYHVFIRTKLGNETVMIDPSCTGCRFMDVRVSLRGDEDIFR